MFFECFGGVAFFKCGEDAVVDGCGVVVGAADSAVCTGEHAEHEQFISAEEEIDFIGDGPAVLEEVEVGAGEFDAGEVGEEVDGFFDVFVGGEVDVGETGDVVEVEGGVSAGFGDGFVIGEKVIDGFSFVEEGGHAGDAGEVEF